MRDTNSYLSNNLRSFVLDKYMVNLKAASLWIGSGFPKEYFGKGANPLGSLESDYVI